MPIRDMQKKDVSSVVAIGKRIKELWPDDKIKFIPKTFRTLIVEMVGKQRR
jgi:hypothetical protein